MRRMVYYAVLVLFNACGLILLAAAVNRYTTAEESTSWPTVRGRMLSVEVVEEEAEHEHRRHGEPPTIVYYAQVRYEYDVDGQRYENDKITVGDVATNQRERAETIAMRYQADQPVTVYYNPEDPQEALLQPGDLGDTVTLTAMGIAFMVIPTGLVLAIGGRELIPYWVRLWWSMKFGRLRDIEDDTASGARQSLPADAAPDKPSSEYPPPDTNFRETIAEWFPGRRVVIEVAPPGWGMLILGSVLIGGVVALFGGVLLGLLLFGAKGAMSQYVMLGLVLFVVVGGSVFAISRLQSRGSRTVFDWETNIVDAHREFSFAWQGSLHDIQALVARLERDRGRHRRYRATLDLEAVGKSFTIVRTLEARRDADKVAAQIKSVAEPLSATLEVPLRMKGWE